jgi:hypothetical protein
LPDADFPAVDHPTAGDWLVWADRAVEAVLEATISAMVVEGGQVMSAPREWTALTIRKSLDGSITISVVDPWSGVVAEVETLASAFRMIEELDRAHNFTGTIPITV